MTFLTIFSAPKKFSDPHIAIIQRNAIRSWLNMGPDVKTLLVGEEPGMQNVADELGVTQLSQVKRNSWGTPLVSSIFQLAREASRSPYLAYVNADILLTPDFVDIARTVSSQVKEFLVVGQRWDLDVTQSLLFEGQWDQVLKQRAKQEGKLHPPAGSDYFIFPRTLFIDMPDFAIGRAGWDNWMIYKALKSRRHVVDATHSLMIIHQNHDYSHLPGGVPHYDLEETAINAALGGGYGNMFMTLDTNFELVDGILRRSRWTRDRVLRRLEKVFRPKDDKDQGIRWRIARRFRRMRRGVM
jgi:hypothetical protein